MKDKTKELHASLLLINDRLLFSGTVANQAPVSIDYIPPLGDDLGYTSLELLLLSLSSCLGSAALPFLRRMKKNIKGFAIDSRGIRSEEHPTAFKTIYLELTVESSDVTGADLDKVIALAEEKYCPVWAMVKGNVEIKVTRQIKP
ncbi:MAG TPA: OsmC family protein [Candidatus Binatia bacterium]|nr:OsmC family protein [Candidatus Binatia bacterium]